MDSRIGGDPLGILKAPKQSPSSGGDPLGILKKKASSESGLNGSTQFISPSNLPSGLQEGSSVFPTKENPLPFPMGQPQPVAQTPPSTFTPDISNNFGLKNPTQLAQENVSRPDNAQIAKIPILKRKNVLGENNGDILEGEDEGVKIASDYAAQQKNINTQKSIINSKILNIHQDVATQKGDMISPKLFTPIPVEDNSKPAVAVKDLHAQTSLLDEQSENLRQQTLQKASSYVSKITNDPTTAGLTVRAVLGDNNAIQQKETLDRGNPVAPSDMYYNDRQGLEALSAGLDENYKDNPEDPEYVAKKKSISAQFSTLIDKYPEFKHQQLAKIVAQQIIKDQKTPSTTGMAFLPPGLRAAKELGLSDEDIKSIDFDNLPIQTPLSSAIGAVYNGVISLGSGIARIGGSAVGMDNNFLTSELAEARRKAEERFADVSTLQGAPTIVDSDKNSPTYLQDIANPQAGKYNYNFHTVSNAISHGVGSLAQFIGGTRLIGGLATKIAPVVDATEAGMAGLMIGQGYEPYYQKANEVISDKPEDEWKRHAYALINGSLDYYAFKALGNVVRDVSPETINEGANIFKSASSLADVNRSALEKWTTKVIKGVKETAGETAFVGGAQAGSEIAKNIVDNVIGNEKAADKSNKELGDVLLTGAESLPFTIMIPVGLSKVISGARGSYVYKENIYNAGLNPETYLGQANKLLNDGVINKEQYDQRAQVINTATKIVNSIPADIELNHNQRVAYTNSKVRELALKAQVEKVDDAALEKFYNDQIQQEVANRTEILNGANKQPFYEQTTNEAAQAENTVPVSTEKTGTTNEAVDNVSKEAEAGTFEDKVRELYPALKNTDDAGVNDFIKENATDTPSKFINDFGQDKFNEVVKNIPTKELQNKLDIILDNNSDNKDVDILDKLISDRESEPQAEQQSVANSAGVSKPDWEQQLKDIQEGNIVTFTYDKESDVPEVFKDKISSTGDTNGKKFVRVTVAKSLADYELNRNTGKQNKPTISKEQQPIVNSNSKNVPSDLATNYNSIADITEQVVADRNSTVGKANKLDDETNKPIRDKIDDIDAQMDKMRKENGVSTDVDLMRKLANDNIIDFGKLVGLRNERDNLYKQISNKNRSEYEKETDRIISEKIKPYQEAIDKEQKRIEDSIGNLSKELGAKSGDFRWGDKPIDEEMGDRIGDNKSAIFIKPHETDIDTFNGEDSIVDGLQIELVTVNEKNRGEGLAKKRLQEITEAADKHQLTLFLDAAPQEKTITEEGLKKLYSQFGFEFDGIHGKREPKPISEPTNKVENNSKNKQTEVPKPRTQSPLPTKEEISKYSAKDKLALVNAVRNKDAKAIQEIAERNRGGNVKFDKSNNADAAFETRDGKRIGFEYDTDKVARERFDFSKLKQIGKGSDRTVFDLGDGKVLKVAHTARGLEQNIYEGDRYLKGIVPDVHERGLNYVVTDKVPRIKANDIVPTYDIETGEQNGTAKAGEMIRELGKFNQKDFDNKTSGIQDALRKYGLGDVMDYDVLYGDFKAGRNWGYEDGRPVHIDGGTFGGTRMLDNYKGKAPLSDPEFRDIYNKSKALKKQFGDTDKNTKFQKSEIKTDEGTMPVEQYVSRAKAVLEKLFPKAKFEAYDTTADYLDAGGTYGSKGLSRVDGKGNRTIMLDLQEIRDSGSGKTAFHEVIHPIVDEVVGMHPEELNPLWNDLAEQMKDVKGFGDVLLHVGNYKAHEHPAAEGITELLTQISEGNISLDAVPPARKGVIIDLLNKLFEKLGLNIRFGDSYDFKSFATDIKKAFETGDAESLKQVVDKKSEENQRAKDNASKISKLLFGSDKADKSETDINDVVKQLRELGLTDKEIEEGLKQSGDSEADIKRALGGGGKSGNGGETEGLGQGDGNAITHAAIDDFRREMGFEPFSHIRMTDAEVNAKADKAIADGYDVQNLFHDIAKGHNPNEVEVVILKKTKAAIDAAVEKNPSKANLKKAADFATASDVAGQIAGRAFRLRQDIDEVDVGKQSLSDFFVTRMRNKGVTPETMTDAQKSEIQKQYKDLKDAHDKLEAKVAKLVEADAKRKAESAVKKMKDRTSSQPKKTHEEYVKERKSLVEQLKAAKAKAEERMKGITKSGFSVTVTPEMVKIIGKIAYSHVSEGAQKLQEVSQKVYNEIKDVFEGVTQQDVVDVLAGAYNAVKPEKNDILKQIAALRSEAIKESSLAKERKDAQRLKTIKKTYQGKIDKLKEDLRTGKYLQEKDKPEPLKLDKEALALKDQYISIKQETQRLIAKDEWKKKTKNERFRHNVIEALNIPRTAMSSSDFSAVLRQAVVPSISHPVVALKSMKGMFADAFSAKKFDRWLFDLKESPLYDDMKKSKVYISDPHDVRLSKKEEAYMNNLVERIPYLGTWLVKGSERAYLSYLNRMRVELYALGSDVLTRNGKTIENSPKDFEGLGSFVNNMTGRGGVPEKMELATPLISAGIFAPRLIASRLNLLGLSDVTGNGFYSKLPPEIRKMAIMDMTKFVLFGSAVLGLSSLVGDDKKNKTVEFDPRSSDFGKIRVGDTRYDIWGGFQQYVTFFARQIAGQSKSVNSGKMYDLDGKGAFGRTRWDTFLSFARGKSSPAVGMGIDFLAGGRTVIGDKILYGNLFGDHKKKEITLGSYLGEHFFPMTSGDIYDAVQSGDMRNLFAIPATIFGISVQTFNDKK